MRSIMERIKCNYEKNFKKQNPPNWDSLTAQS